MDIFSERFKKLKEAKQSTYPQIAEYLHLQPRTVKGYASGDIKPDFHKLSALATYFNVPIDYLVGSGAFAQWDLVMQPQYLSAVAEAAMIHYNLDISSLPEQKLMLLLPALFGHIVIDPASDAITLSPLLHPADLSAPARKSRED